MLRLLIILNHNQNVRLFFPYSFCRWWNLSVSALNLNAPADSAPWRQHPGYPQTTTQRGLWSGASRWRVRVSRVDGLGGCGTGHPETTAQRGLWSSGPFVDESGWVEWVRVGGGDAVQSGTGHPQTASQRSLRSGANRKRIRVNRVGGRVWCSIASICFAP